MTYEEMRAAQFEVCRAWLQTYADQGLWINEAARRSGVAQSTICRMAKACGVKFEAKPPKPPKKATKAALRKMEANLKTQLSHHTKFFLKAGYKPESAKIEAFRMVRANIEQGARV